MHLGTRLGSTAHGLWTRAPRIAFSLLCSAVKRTGTGFNNSGGVIVLVRVLTESSGGRLQVVLTQRRSVGRSVDGPTSVQHRGICDEPDQQ